MPAKKKSPAPNEQAKEVKEPIGRHSKKFKDQLVEVAPTTYFADGMLAEFFTQLGYPVEWPRMQKRSIPIWLLDRCKQSGGDFIAAKDVNPRDLIEFTDTNND